MAKLNINAVEKYKSILHPQGGGREGLFAELILNRFYCPLIKSGDKFQGSEIALRQSRRKIPGRHWHSVNTLTVYTMCGTQVDFRDSLDFDQVRISRFSLQVSL